MIESQTAKRPAAAGIDALRMLPAPKRIRLEAPETTSEDSSASIAATPTSPPSTHSDGNVSVTATSFTSRSASKRPKKYVCHYEACDKAFDRPVRLQAHLRTHTGDRPFACEEGGCDKTFFKPEHLKAHVQNKHSPEAIHVCSYVISVDEHDEDVKCGKTFTTSSRLRRHVATHEKAEELKCHEAECGLVFRKMETLQRHIKKLHLKEESFRCQKLVVDEQSGMEEECAQTFATVGQLKSHESREHVGMKYFCSVCSPPQDGQVQTVGFPTYAHYQAHLKLVHPPTCTICLQPCESNRALAAHMEIEHSTLSSRKQNYTCDYPGCERGFTRKGNLTVHIQSVHVKKKRFICGDADLSGNDKCPGWETGMACGSAFTTKASLVGHVRTQHLQLADLYHARKTVKFKEEGDDATTFSEMSLDRPADFDSPTNGQSALGLLTGFDYADARPMECWTADCPVRFSRDYDLARHMELAHGWNVDDVNEHFAEKEALEGGQFWIGGAEETAIEEGSEDFALRESLSQALSLRNKDNIRTDLEHVTHQMTNGSLLGDITYVDNERMKDTRTMSEVVGRPMIMNDSDTVTYSMAIDPALLGQGT